MSAFSLRKFLHDQRGTIAEITGISATAVLGVAALAVDVGSWEVAQRSMQGAADAAAYSAAIAYRVNNGASIVTQAKGVTAQMRYVDGQNGATVSVNQPPASGGYTKDSTGIEVIIQQPQARFLSGLVLSSNPTVSARAVAVMPNGCILALDKTATKAIDISGWASVTSKCDMISDSKAANSINMGGSSTASVPCMVASGGVSVTANLTETACSSPITNAPYTPDPYAGLQAPSASGPCLTVTSNTLSSGNYCSGIHLSSQSSYTFGAGPYYIGGGGLQIDGGVTAVGTGVTFFMQPGATVTINASTTVSFSAPTSGTYAGIVFFGDQTQNPGATNSFTGGSNLTLTGSLYFKTQEVTYNGGSAANACTQIVADTIKLTGNTFFNSGCSGGGLTNVTTIELVE